MKNENLVADIFKWVFVMVSFSLYAINQINLTGYSAVIAILIYIFPNMINCITDLSDKFLQKKILVLTVISIIVGSIILIVCFVCMAKSAVPNSYIRYLFVILSLSFLVRETWILTFKIIRVFRTHRRFNSVEGE